MSRMFAIFKGILRDALDADGKKIVNLATPTQDADAANKAYVDSHAGGSPSWENIQNKPTTFPPSAHAASHSAGGTDPISIAQSQVAGLADALAAKRDRTDEGCYNKTFTEWTRTRGELDLTPNWVDEEDDWGDGWGWLAGSFQLEDKDGNFARDRNATYVKYNLEEEIVWERTASASPDTSHKLARRDADAASAIAKFDADGNLVADNSGKGLSKNDYTDEDKAEVAKVKDKADEFTAWDTIYLPNGVTVTSGPEWSEGNHHWEMVTSDGYSWYGPVEEEDAAEIAWYTEAPPYAPISTRKRVLRTGEALAPGLGSDGVPTDANVRDLFSESDTSTAANPDLNNKVLQASVNVIVAAKTATVATSATAPTSVTLADNDCKTVTMGTATALQIDFGAAKQTGALRLCELVIADAPSTALTLSFPSGHTFHSSMASGKWYTTETGRNHFLFEETAANVWTVTRQVETSDTPTTTHTEGDAE